VTRAAGMCRARGTEPFHERQRSAPAAPTPAERLRGQEGGRGLGEDKLGSLLERDGVAKDLGVEFVELEAGRVVARMPIDGRHLQPFGYLHGGVSVVLAESVASIGAFLNCPPGKGAFGSEINASHLRPKRAGGALTATGTPVHAGRRSQVWQVLVEDEDGKAVCAVRCTVAIVDLEP
jgi:1,4-dihydroxy-2-naphthoyl-CoA hydrolase